MNDILIPESINKKIYCSVHGFYSFCFKQKRAGLFNAGNQSLKEREKVKTIRAIVSIIILQVIFSNCTRVAYWLKKDLKSAEPAAIFECDLQKAGSDTLILLGIEDSRLIAGLKRWKTIGFFLKNKNIDSLAVNQGEGEPSSFIHFVRVNNEYFDDLVMDFPQLIEMEIFAAYLKGLTVEQEKFLRFKTLKDGDLRNMLSRQIEYVRERRICFIVVNLTGENSARYQEQVRNIFQ